jgi:hypothetical protein
MGWMAPAPGVAAPRCAVTQHERGATMMEITTVCPDFMRSAARAEWWSGAL